MSLPRGSDGKELCVGTTVKIHGVSDDTSRCLLNGQRGYCERWDSQVGRMFVRISPVEALAFSPQNLRVISEEEYETYEARTEGPPHSSGGQLLGPGAIVRVHGFRAESSQWLNDQIGVCERWNRKDGIMSVRLESGGAPKLIRPKHLRKVRMCDEEHMDPVFKRALDIFRHFDKDGDGVMENKEFGSILAAMGMSSSIVDVFLADVDKNHDNDVSYDEFLSWVLCPVDSSKLRLDMYWPKDGSSVLDNPSNLASVDETVDHSDGESSDDEMDQQTLERAVGPLPQGWPPHGMAAVNNCRVRFPDCSLECIVQTLAENDFMGGRAIAAIRKITAKENDAVRWSATPKGRARASLFRRV